MRKLVIFCLFLASGGVASAQSVLPAGFGQWTGVPLAASAQPSLEQVTGANARNPLRSMAINRCSRAITCAKATRCM